MKRSIISLGGLLALMILVQPALAGDDHAGQWFDLENCGMCKNLSAQPGLLENIAWEHYMVEDGMMTVTVVPENQKAAMGRAMEGMKKAETALKSGEQVHLCNFCQSMGGIMMSGKAKVQNIETIAGDIMLVTSSDPATVKQIHAHGQRTIKEMKAMEAAMMEESSE